MDDPTLRWLDGELSAIPEASPTFRVLQGLALVLPASPPIEPYLTLDAGLALSTPALTDAGLGFARAKAVDEAVRQALFVGKSLDTGDAGFTVLTGLRTALALFMGWDIEGLSRGQQQVDAAAKALGLGLLAWRLFEGTAAERVEALRQIPEGRTLLCTWAAVEVALPFGDEVEAASGSFVRNLIRDNLQAVRSRVGRIVDTEGLEQAEETLDSLAVVLDQLVVHALPGVSGIAETLTHTLPRVHDQAKVASLAALAADTLPLYRLLTARLAVGRCRWLAQNKPVFDSPLDPSTDPFLRPLERPFQAPPQPPSFDAIVPPVVEDVLEGEGGASAREGLAEASEPAVSTGSVAHLRRGFPTILPGGDDG